jgi:predicted RNase H-like HicB family nuclease
MASFTIVVYEAEEGGYWAKVPELPGCASQGETLDELRHNITGAIQAWLETMEEAGAPLPPLKAAAWELPLPDPDLVSAG